MSLHTGPSLREKGSGRFNQEPPVTMDEPTSPQSLSPSNMDISLVTSRSSLRPKPYDYSIPLVSGCSGNIKSFSKNATSDIAKYSDMSIRKTAIDWRLVKKEAEAIRLRTENQRLQAL